MEVEVIIINLSTKTKMVQEKDEQPRQVTLIQIETEMNPSQLAQILEYQRAGRPLFMSVSSPQASLDLGGASESRETASVS